MLQLPLVQQQLVDSFARRLSHKTGIAIHPGRVYVGLFRPLLMQDFLLQSTQGDTLLHLGRMEVAIQPFALFRQEVQIPELVLQDIQLSLVRAAADSTFNFQALLDAFSSDRPREEKQPTAWTFQLRQLRIQDTHLYLYDSVGCYELNTRLGFLEIIPHSLRLDTLAFGLQQIQLTNTRVAYTQLAGLPSQARSEKPTAAFPQLPFPITVEHLLLANNQLVYTDATTPPQAAGLDFGHLHLSELELEAQQISWQADSLVAQIRHLGVQEQSGFKLSELRTRAFLGRRQIQLQDLVLRTPQSNIQLNGRINYADFADWTQNLADRVYLDAQLDNTSIAFQDLGYFSPGIQQLKSINTDLQRTILAKARLRGTLANMQHLAFQLSIADDLTLAARGSARRLTQPQQLQLDLELQTLATSYDQLKRLTRNTAIPKGLAGLGRIQLSGQFQGGLDTLKARQIELQTSSTTYLAADFELHRLMDSLPPDFKLDLHNLQTNATDLAGFLNQRDLPAGLFELGTLQYNGQIAGTPYQLQTNGRLRSDIGQLTADAQIQFNADYSDARYGGTVQLDSFALGRLLQDSSLGTVTLGLRVAGSGLQIEQLNTRLQATIHSLVYRDYTYQRLRINGQIQQQVLSGTIALRAPHLSFDFSGVANLRDSLPSWQFKARIDTLHPRSLHLADVPYAFSGKLESNFQGRKMDELNGTLDLSHFFISNDKDTYYGDQLKLRAIHTDTSDQLSLSSPFLHLDLLGDYQPTQIAQLLKTYRDHYLPKDSVVLATLPPPSNFSGALYLHHPTPLLRIFSPMIEQLDTASLLFAFRPEDKAIDLQLQAPRIGIAGKSLDSLQIRLNGTAKQLELELRAQQLDYGLPEATEWLAVNSLLANDSLQFNLLAGQKPGSATQPLLAFGGKASIRHNDYSLMFNEAFWLNNQLWQINPDHEFRYRNGDLNIAQLNLSQEDQMLAVFTEASSKDRRLPPLHINFKRFRVSELLKMLQLSELDYEGYINGSVSLLDYQQNLSYLTNLDIQHIMLEEQAVGNLRLKAIQANKQNPQIQLRANLNGPEGSFNASGTYTPASQQIALNASFDQLRLRLLDPFLYGIIRESSGQIGGNLNLWGKANNPQVTGSMQLDSIATIFGISGVRYRIPQETLRFDNNRIHFVETEVLDEAGNIAYLNGYLDLSDYGDVGLGLDFRTQRFQVLNTPRVDEALYYGQLFVSAAVTLRGSALNPVINMQAGTLAPSQLFVQPLSFEQAIADRENYLLFGHPTTYQQQTEGQKPVSVYRPDPNGLDLTLNLEVTPDAELQVIIDPTTGDKLVCRGNAEATVRMTPDGQLDILGNYRIVDGRYALNYQGMLKKDFTIEAGSRLDFLGDPMATRFDLTAIYRTQTPTFELIRNRLTDENSAEAIAAKRRQQVEILLQMEGDLQEPVISFDIDVPDDAALTSATRQELQRIRENETELNKQVFSLLLLNSFLAEQSGGGSLADAGTSVYLSSVSALLSNQLNRLADNYLKGVDVNIGIDSYQSAYDLGEAGNTVTEFNLGVSRQLFNERLSIQAGGNLNLNSANSSIVEGANFSSIAGDFLLEYQLTESGNIRLRVFRRDNYDVLNQSNLPQTGVGISFSKSFGDINRKKSKQ